MIDLVGLCVEYRNFSLKDINLLIDNGDYFLLVGPTGAGKTMLLETIAGLHFLKQGTILFDGEDLTGLEPEKRGIGIVYQDCALFHHLSVADNITFGLKIRKVSQLMVKKQLAEVASLVKVKHLLERKPGKLSGGEKQKVALARALAVRPRLLLLDEPFNALDSESRDELQQELKQIHHELGITVIHVTHDFDEALTLGKHIAVMGGGGIKQVGTPDEIFFQPNSEFVAHFTGMRNIFSGELLKETKNHAVFRSGSLEFVTATYKEGASHACIRPEDISLFTDFTLHRAPNILTGTVVRVEERRMAFQIFINVPPEVCCLVTRRNFSEMGLTIGQNVKIHFNPDSVHVF